MDVAVAVGKNCLVTLKNASLNINQFCSQLLSRIIRDYTDILVKTLHAAVNYGHVTSLCIILDALKLAELACIVNNAAEFQIGRHQWNENWTALHIAVYRGHLECIEKLKLADADPVKPDRRSYLPIHVAADSSNSDVLRVFLKLFCRINDGEQLNAYNRFGMTPLMCCAVLGNTKGVELLLEHGADATLCGKLISKSTPRPADDNCVGQNLLHIIVQKSVEKPNCLENFIGIFEAVRKMYKDDDGRKLNEDLLQIFGNCSFGSRFSNVQMTVVQFAASIGAIDLLDVIVNSLPAEKTSDDGQKNTEYTPDILQQLLPLEEEHDSCLELVSRHCTIDETAKITRITPITEFVARFSFIRSSVFCILLLFHATYMGLFTHVVVSNYIKKLEVQNTTTLANSHSHLWLSFFLVWPSVLILYEIVCFILIVAYRPWRQYLKHKFSKFLRRIWWYRGRSRANNKAAAEKSRYSIVNLDAISHVTTAMFAVLMLAWCCVASTVANCNAPWFLGDVTVGLSATVLIWGWMQTLEYVRCPQKLHAFVVIVKVIFIKDVFYILCIYVFIMMGFASAVYIYMLTEAGTRGSSTMTFTTCVYHSYATMLGDGALFELDAVTDANSHALRVVFSIYLCLSIIVLLNMLIAMMNNRYANVIDIKETLWFIETLNCIAWICRLMPYVRDCLFKRMCHGIAKHQSALSTDDDQVKQLSGRLSAVESSLNELRQRLEQIGPIYTTKTTENNA